MYSAMKTGCKDRTTPLVASRVCDATVYEVRRPTSTPTHRSSAAMRGARRPLPLSPAGGRAAATTSAPTVAVADGTTALFLRPINDVKSPGSTGSLRVRPPDRALQKRSNRRPLDRGNAADLIATTRQWAGTSALVSSSSSLPSVILTPAHVELYLRYVVDAAAATMAPRLLSLLQNVLRSLQHDRHLSTGQQPFRRHSLLSGTSEAAAVGRCLAMASVAPTLDGAYNILRTFLAEWGASNSSAAVASSSASLPTDAASSAATILIGATLAELYFSNAQSLQAACTDAATVGQLLSYLDVAVEAGHPGAMYRVGLCLCSGLGTFVAADAESGVTWLRYAAALHYLPSLHAMGEWHESDSPNHPQKRVSGRSNETESSEETPESSSDWAAAVEWYQQSATAGYAPSQLNLGKLYLRIAEQGLSDKSASKEAVAPLRAKAKEWLRMAAAAGVEEAKRLEQRL